MPPRPRWLAEFRAVVGLALQVPLYFLLPKTVIPSFLCWQSAVYLVAAFLIQRRLAAGGRCKSKKNLAGKTAIVTGSNTGIGFEIAKRLVRQNANVYLACRSEQRAAPAIARLSKYAAKNNSRVEFLQLDLADYSQVRSAASKILEKTGNRIDYLVNNAGVMDAAGNLPQKLPNGHETHIGTNHLGTILFTELVKPAVLATKGRIVILASQAQRRSCNSSSPGALFQEFMKHEEQEKKGKFMVPYGCSKAGNIIYARYLAKKHPEIIVTANHPGVVQTELVRSPLLQTLLWPLAKLILKSPKDGAQTSLVGALDDVQSGGYYCDCRQMEDRPIPAVNDEQSQKAIMDWSLQTLGLTAFADKNQVD